MNALLLLSNQAGTGRTTVAASLAGLLALAGKCNVCLLETGAAELTLHTGLGADIQTNPVNLLRARTGETPGAALARAADHAFWTIVDGKDLRDPDWQEWLEACGRGLLLERGDLVGARRAGDLIKTLESAHFARQGLLFAWSGGEGLLEFENLTTHSIPTYPRTIERLAQTLPISAADSSAPFSKELKRIAETILKMPVMEKRTAQAVHNPAQTQEKTDGSAAGAPWESQWHSKVDLMRELLSQLRERLDMDKAENDDELRQSVKEEIDTLLAARKDKWLTRELRATLSNDLFEQVLGYGPLAGALADPQITEIMVNRADQVYLEKAGRLSLSELRFWDDAQVRGVIERIVAPLGRRIDESSPMVDARLPDGSRVNAIIPPLAVHGPCLTIRKFPSKRLTIDDLLQYGSITADCAQLIEQAVQLKKNIVVSGGTGSGKTTILNILSSRIPEGERVVTIEDSAELRLAQPHVVSLESRPANLEGQGQVTIRDLVRNALRMRPDRIVVGECRGGEALDMLQAMNTGHEGSLTTVHANTPRDALARLETLSLMSDVQLPLTVLRHQVASAVDLIIQIARLRDGSRRVTAVTEITGMEGDIIVSQDLFEFQESGMDSKGRVLGDLAATGVVANFVREARGNGQLAAN